MNFDFIAYKQVSKKFLTYKNSSKCAIKTYPIIFNFKQMPAIQNCSYYKSTPVYSEHASSKSIQKICKYHVF